jgi:hypothetical protein
MYSIRQHKNLAIQYILLQLALYNPAMKYLSLEHWDIPALS